jgi:acyl dehydratase
MSGRYFEDFEIGERFTTEEREITERDIVQFADLTGDRNALHLDAAYAKTTEFGERIAHGLLGLSIASGLWVQLGLLEKTIIAFLGLEWKFIAPVRIGDRVHVILSVIEKKETKRADRGIIRFGAIFLSKDKEAVQEGVWTLLIQRKQ